MHGFVRSMTICLQVSIHFVQCLARLEHHKFLSVVCGFGLWQKCAFFTTTYFHARLQNLMLFTDLNTCCKHVYGKSSVVGSENARLHYSLQALFPCGQKKIRIPSGPLCSVKPPEEALSFHIPGTRKAEK